MKKKKIMKWLNNLVTTVLFALFISVAFMVIVTKVSGGDPEVLGYQFKTVLSGSMEPGIQTGSIIAVKTGGDMTRFKGNDVITFIDEEQDLITHRIIEVTQSGDNTMYQTKGDNNNVPDVNPVLSENVIAVYEGLTIPYIGYLINFAQSQNGAFLLLIPGLLLLMYSSFTIWKALSELNIPKSENEKVSSSKQ